MYTNPQVEYIKNLRLYFNILYNSIKNKYYLTHIAVFGKTQITHHWLSMVGFLNGLNISHKVNSNFSGDQPEGRPQRKSGSIKVSFILKN